MIKYKYKHHFTDAKVNPSLGIENADAPKKTQDVGVADLGTEADLEFRVGRERLPELPVHKWMRERQQQE